MFLTVRSPRHKTKASVHTTDELTITLHQCTQAIFTACPNPWCECHDRNILPLLGELWFDLKNRAYVLRCAEFTDDAYSFAHFDRFPDGDMAPAFKF